MRTIQIRSGSVNRYLLYAVGEIALVVIGILIALQINNWNIKKNLQSQIKTYLIGLVESLNEDILSLENTQIHNSFRSECLKQLLIVSNTAPAGDIPVIKYDFKSRSYWNGPIPDGYDREFSELCFKRTGFGSIIVFNQATFEEFKNVGLFSYIENEKLKKQINDYYVNMNWNFSDWREANFRAEIDEWEDFLRDRHQLNYINVSMVHDLRELIKNNRDIQLEMEELLVDAVYRSNYAGDCKLEAEELIQAIQTEILKI